VQINKEKWFPILGHVFRIGIAIAIITYFWFSGYFDFKSIGNALEKVDLLFLSFVFLLVCILIAVERWHILLQAIEVDCDRGLATRLTFIGTFFSVALPGTLGGDAVKAYYLARGRDNKTALVTTVILDRVIGLYTMIAVAAIASVFVLGVNLLIEKQSWWSPGLSALAVFLIVLFCIASLAGFFLLSSRFNKTRLMQFFLTKGPFHKVINKVYQAIYHYRSRMAFIRRALFFSLISQFFGYLSIYVLAIALVIEELEFVHYLFVLPVCFVINAIPLAPGGLGVGEAGFGKVFNLFGSAQGIELAILYHLVFFFIALGIGGIIYMLSGKALKQAIEK
jgi:uncharacterized protein (TIRG00374 family)